MRVVRSIVVAALLAVSVEQAAGQNWPTRPITMVVPYGPGSGSDVLARLIAPRMSELLGQPVLIENVSGGGGMIGSLRVAKAAPDGYQSVIGTAGTHAQYQFLTKNPSYLASDFAPVVLIADQPFVLITRKDFPASNFRQFTAYGKANPSSLKYGSPGLGSAGHLACAFLNNAIGIETTHIPYRGAAQAMTDLMSGQIDYQCVVVSAVMPQLESATVKAIAMLAPQRSPFLPNLPSTAEEGLAEFDASTWNALFLPKDTPAAIVKKLNDVVAAALQTPAVKDRLRVIGTDTPGIGRLSVEYVTKLVDDDVKKWAAPLRAAKISLD